MPNETDDGGARVTLRLQPKLLGKLDRACIAMRESGAGYISRNALIEAILDKADLSVIVKEGAK